MSQAETARSFILKVSGRVTEIRRGFPFNNLQNREIVCASIHVTDLLLTHAAVSALGGTVLCIRQQITWTNWEEVVLATRALRYAALVVEFSESKIETGVASEFPIFYLQQVFKLTQYVSETLDLGVSPENLPQWINLKKQVLQALISLHIDPPIFK